jgi:uncharacterized protein with LGFP repeats
MHYVAGARRARVYGAICEKWLQLGGEQGFGAPTSEETAEGAGRVSHFGQSAIYWGPQTGAHEVHGLIAQAYFQAGGARSCLGLPISDEESAPSGRVNRVPERQDRMEARRRGSARGMRDG